MYKQCIYCIALYFYLREVPIFATLVDDIHSKICEKKPFKTTVGDITNNLHRAEVSVYTVCKLLVCSKN